MLDPEVLAPGKDAGYPNGYAYYVVGRGGVLGDVDAAVVTSAFGFFAPDLVAKMWNTGIPVEGARAGADRYTEGCRQWGRTRLGEWAGSARLADLIERVVDSADASGAALFAGWRAQQRPTDPAGRCYQLLHVLREMRGAVHLISVVASGLTPLQAVVSNPNGGPAQAQRFGWSEPFPAAAPDAFAAAEARTDDLMAGHLAVLTEAELVELATLVDDAAHRVFG